ncbi:hypothetical protein O0I10_013301 [Lichtheimia ornata]|uniref:Secreted protein n=1 Tax=Lichtheimia ornata TaxID=688661 RepID=A0AAD7XV27_9FUNG|nr:uncharacterized protein O0I10_013301 [Lichtheimia ornata]KAJ8651232.1 hypothetical protein O0I10_013301 [Lichtheimia ornata]
MDVSHQQQTTMLRVLLVLSRCIHLSWHSSSSIAWRTGYQNWSLCRHLYSKEMCYDYWVASNIVDSHMTLAKSTFEFGWVSQKQASDLYLIVVVVKDTVSMVLEISYTCKSSLYRWIFRAMFLSVPWRISFLKNLYGYLGRPLGFSRMLFIKTGFTCCSA